MFSLSMWKLWTCSAMISPHVGVRAVAPSNAIAASVALSPGPVDGRLGKPIAPTSIVTFTEDAESDDADEASCPSDAVEEEPGSFTQVGSDLAGDMTKVDNSVPLPEEMEERYNQNERRSNMIEKLGDLINARECKSSWWYCTPDLESKGVTDLVDMVCEAATIYERVKDLGTAKFTAEGKPLNLLGGAQQKARVKNLDGWEKYAQALGVLGHKLGQDPNVPASTFEKLDGCLADESEEWFKKGAQPFEKAHPFLRAVGVLIPGTSGHGGQHGAPAGGNLGTGEGTEQGGCSGGCSALETTQVEGHRAADGDDFFVCSVNVIQQSLKKHNQILRKIKKTINKMPTMLLVQESVGNLYEGPETPGHYHGLSEYGWGTYEGISTFLLHDSGWEWLESKTMEIWDEGCLTTPTPRVSLVTTFRHVAKRAELKLANVHMCGGKFDDPQIFSQCHDHKGEAFCNSREAQIKKVIAHKPDIIMGDFNAPFERSFAEAAYTVAYAESAFCDLYNKDTWEQNVQAFHTWRNSPYERLEEAGYVLLNEFHVTVPVDSPCDMVWVKKGTSVRGVEEASNAIVSRKTTGPMVTALSEIKKKVAGFHLLAQTTGQDAKKADVMHEEMKDGKLVEVRPKWDAAKKEARNHGKILVDLASGLEDKVSGVRAHVIGTSGLFTKTETRAPPFYKKKESSTDHEAVCVKLSVTNTNELTLMEAVPRV